MDEAGLLEQAARHRLGLGNVVAVAVTGSCGKTTTTDLIAAVLSCRYRGRHSDGAWNCGLGVVHSLLAVRPGDDFFVQELGAWGPGTLDAGIELVRPDIVVVTNLRNDHYSSFHGPRGALAEKGKLVAAVAPGGTAVLNCDDPLAGELAARASARTFWFGRSPGADLRARDVTARWPERLTFSADYGGQTRRVRTRLLGEHLLGSALAALAVGLVFGLTLDEAASALEGAEPSPRRMSPVLLDDGVTFIRDDYKAPADSIPEVLAFMAGARAGRKVAVFGRISDFPGRSRRCYTRIAREAVAVLQTVIFVGPRAAELWGRCRSTAPGDQAALRERLQLDGPVPQAAGPAGWLEQEALQLACSLEQGSLELGATQSKGSLGQGSPRSAGSLELGAAQFAGSLEQGCARSAGASAPAPVPGDMLVFERVREASDFLAGFLRGGDLVLLKGSGPADHLERVLLSRQQAVRCWLPRCGRIQACDACPLLDAPAA